jgi:hypothetical protein
MNGLLAGLAALAQPILARVLIALGFSVLTVTGVTVALDGLKSVVVTHLAGMPVAAIQLGGLFGLWQGIGMVFGACTFVVTLWTLKRAVSIAGVPG